MRPCGLCGSAAGCLERPGQTDLQNSMTAGCFSQDGTSRSMTEASWKEAQRCCQSEWTLQLAVPWQPFCALNRSHMLTMSESHTWSRNDPHEAQAWSTSVAQYVLGLENVSASVVYVPVSL